MLAWSVQPPSLDSNVGPITSQRAKLDILIHTPIQTSFSGCGLSNRLVSGAARINNQTLLTGLQACQKPALGGDSVTDLQVFTHLGMGSVKVETRLTL